MSDLTPDLTAPGGDDLSIDFSDVTVKSFDPIPKGWYRVTIVDYEDVETKNAGKLPAGTPGINWEFEVSEGDFENRKLWTNHWLAPSTLGFLKGLFEAVLGKENVPSNITRTDIDDLIGKEVDVKVKVRPASGKYDESNDCQAFAPAGQNSGGKAAESAILP